MVSVFSKNTERVCNFLILKEFPQKIDTPNPRTPFLTVFKALLTEVTCMSHMTYEMSNMTYISHILTYLPQSDIS